MALADQNPLLAPGWWKRPEAVCAVICIAAQQALAQNLLTQGTWPFQLVVYLVSLLTALGLGGALLTAQRKKEEPNPAQEEKIIEQGVKIVALSQENVMLSADSHTAPVIAAPTPR